MKKTWELTYNKVNYSPLVAHATEVGASYQPCGFQSVPLSRPRSSCGPEIFIF